MERRIAGARKVASRRGVTLRTLIEEGLRHVVKGDSARPGFQLKDASFTGRGLDPAFGEGEWERIRDTAYTGRGA